MRGFPIQETPSPIPGSPFPQGEVPVSITKQLAALELEEIPNEYKLSGRGGARWLLVGAVGATLVALGVVMALLLSGDGEPPNVRLRVDTLPQGATIVIDGRELPSKSPVLFDGAEIGRRYLVRAELPGYEPKEKEIVIKGDADQLLFLDRIPLRLVVTSRPPADLFVDSVRVGRTPHERRYQTTPGVIELRLEGYKPHRVELQWGEGETEKVIEVELDKK